MPLPTVAGGGFLPYGIGSQEFGGTAQDAVNSEVLNAVIQLQELITSFAQAVDNMQWVAQFGDARAIAEEVTKIQRQAGIASGVM